MKIKATITEIIDINEEVYSELYESENEDKKWSDLSDSEKLEIISSAENDIGYEGIIDTLASGGEVKLELP
jgi:hypothetical protein